jgi:hypothetical protein
VATRTRRTLAEPTPDPFGERKRAAFRKSLHVLGARFDFETNSARLMRIVQQAYARLPSHRFSDRTRCKLSLLLTPGARTASLTASEAPRMRALAGAGLLCGAIDGSGFAALSARQRSGLLVIAHELLRYPYHLRYELLEFAVYVLAGRVQRLVPLHAGCLGHAGQGVLLVGASGCGKSTLVLHGLLTGLDLLAEDSVLVQPQRLLATGVASFVHVRADSLRFLDAAQRRLLRSKSTLIRRRSGVEKLEIDVRSGGYRLASRPLRIRAVVFLSSRAAVGRRLLHPLTCQGMLERLAASQRYAAHQPGWKPFCGQVARLPAYELRRGAHPLEGVEAVRALLT